MIFLTWYKTKNFIKKLEHHKLYSQTNKTFLKTLLLENTIKMTLNIRKFPFSNWVSLISKSSIDFIVESFKYE